MSHAARVGGVTGMDDLVTWLRAQLDDDERVATAAYANVWHVEETQHHEFLIVPDHFPSTPAVARTAPNAEHIARWDPARVLAEVAAKRRILDRYEDALARQQDPEYSQVAAHVQAEEYEDWILPSLALPYADRPGYRDE